MIDKSTKQTLVEEGTEFTGTLTSKCPIVVMGKVADLGRSGLPCPPWEQRGWYFQTFGLFQLTWPRHAMVREVSRRLCHQIVQRWLSKDSKPIFSFVVREFGAAAGNTPVKNGVVGWVMVQH